MPGPARLIRTAAGLPLGAARRAAGMALRAVPRVGDGRERQREPEADPRREDAAEAAWATPTEADAAEAAERALERERESVEEAAVLEEQPLEMTEPGEEVVSESADLAATEPPGPEFHVDEPWDGYRRMRASEITARLEGQPPEVLAAVELYEASHRNRSTVLDAVRAIRA